MYLFALLKRKYTDIKQGIAMIMIADIFIDINMVRMMETMIVKMLTMSSMAVLLIKNLIFTASLILEIISPVLMVSKKREESFRRCL